MNPSPLYMVAVLSGKLVIKYGKHYGYCRYYGETILGDGISPHDGFGRNSQYAESGDGYMIGCGFFWNFTLGGATVKLRNHS